MLGRVPRPGKPRPRGGKRAFDCRGDGRAVLFSRIITDVICTVLAKISSVRAVVSTLVNRLEAEPEADLRSTSPAPLSEGSGSALSSVLRCIAKRRITLLTRDESAGPSRFWKLLRALPPSTQRLSREMPILNASPRIKENAMPTRPPYPREAYTSPLKRHAGPDGDVVSATG